MSNKVITIDGKEYNISCTAYTRFLYKKTFGTGIMADLKTLSDISTKQDEYRKELKKKKLTNEEIDLQVNNMFLDNIDDFVDIIEKLAYILVLTANPNFGSYEDFLKGIETIDLSSPWVSEVTELTVGSFR